MKNIIIVIGMALCLTANAQDSHKLYGFAKLGPASDSYLAIGATVYLIDSSSISSKDNKFDRPVDIDFAMIKKAEQHLGVLAEQKYIGGAGYYTQEYKVNGKVDKKRKKEILESFKKDLDSANGQIGLLELLSTKKTIVDVNGKFDFEDIPNGTYYLLLKGERSPNRSPDVFKVSAPVAIDKDTSVNFD